MIIVRMFFDGDNDYVEIPMSKSLQIEDEITMNVWVNVEIVVEKIYLIFTHDDYYSLDVDDNYGSDDNRRFTWGGKSGGYGDRRGLNCCYSSVVGITDGGSGRAFQGQWYMITYTLTKEENDGEIIYKYRGYYNGELLQTEITYNNWNRSVPGLETKLFLGVANQIKWIIIII